MATYIFDKIAKEFADSNVSSNNSRDWLRDRASEISNVNPSRMMRDSSQRAIRSNDVGSMMMFFYDAKTKDKLPYWDRFPLIFVVDIQNDGFTGINLHYLSPILRARLMDALYDIEQTQQGEKKLRLSYNTLKSASRFRYFKPTFKKYLNSQVRSRFLNVPSESWDVALMLPTQRFVGAGKNTVWRESRNAI